MKVLFILLSFVYVVAVNAEDAPTPAPAPPKIDQTIKEEALLKIPPGYGGTIDGMSFMNEIYRAQASYVRALSETRLYAAQTFLEDAKTLRQMEVNERLSLLLNNLQAEMSVMYRDQQYHLSLLRAIGKRMNAVNSMKLGKISDATFFSLSWFFTKFYSTAAVLQMVSRPVGLIPAENFLANGEGGKNAPFPGGTMGDYLRFLQLKDLSARPSSVAHQTLLHFTQQFADLGNLRLSRMNEQMTKARNELFNGFVKVAAPVQ